MPRRILHYEIEIIESAIDHKKIKKDEKIPTVIPIVIYTGTAKWNAKKYFKECQEILKGAERVGLGNYYIIDTNKYTKEELLNNVLFTYSLMLIEQKKNTEELAEVIEEVIQKKYKENSELLEQSIYYIYSEKLGKEKTEELLEKLKELKYEGGKSMVLEMIRKENEGLINRGKLEGIRQTTKKMIIGMLQNNANDEFIKKVAKISEKELQEIKNSM